MPFTTITGVAYRKKMMRLRSPACRKKMMKRTVEESREDRKKRLKMMLPAINPAESARAEEGRKKSLTMSVITGEESPAHKKKKKRLPLTASTVPAGVPTAANIIEDSPANQKKNKKTKRTRENLLADGKKKKKRMRLTANTVPAAVPATANTVEDSPANNKKKKRMRLTANTVPADRKKKKQKQKKSAINVELADGWKRIQLTAVTGEEMEAHKAEWAELISKSDPDRILPWMSRYKAGMDDKTQWPPIWKERIEECPEYEVLESYLENPYQSHSETFVEQMRESRGYDVTAWGYGFHVFCPGMIDQYSQNSTVVCQYVTDQINEHAKEYGKFYNWDEVKKIAKARDGRYFYTFTVLEATSQQVKTVQAYVIFRLYYEKLLVYLKEWRFKPESLNLNKNADAVDDNRFYTCLDCYDCGCLYPQSHMKWSVEESREDRKKRLKMLPAINLAASARAEEGRKKRLTLSVITGEELEARKAKWSAEFLKSDPDRVPPWKSRYGAGMENKNQWPPIWKERFEECPEYEALRDFLIYEPANYRSFKIINETLAEQIRESRGYDVAEGGYGFCVYSPGMMRENSHISRVVCKYVTDQINELAQKHGELYVYVEAKKIAMLGRFNYLYTFTVKEAVSHELKTVQAYVHSQTFCHKLLVYLKEWRFKPE